MHQMGLVCALTLSVISGGFRMDWDPALGEAIPIFLRNHPSAFEEAAFVTAAIAAGVTARTMRAVPRDSLKCILPLGVAVNSAGKRRLIWDGRHVNRNLRKRKFRMETLQREGRQLFERSLYGGTADISSAYHHIEMEESATPFLGFEWEGAFYCFDVLPFGLSSAPWLFTTVMGHCARFLRYTGVDLICYLDDIIFGADSARGALQSAQFMLRTLRQFGWLIHPTKCVGVSEAVQTFTALGTLVDLATQTYSVPAATVDRILSGLTALTTGGPSVGVRSLARTKGLIASTWVATGVATRVRTREMDRVIASRAHAAGSSRRERRASWAGVVTLLPPHAWKSFAGGSPICGVSTAAPSALRPSRGGSIASPSVTRATPASEQSRSWRGWPPPPRPWLQPCSLGAQRCWASGPFYAGSGAASNTLPPYQGTFSTPAPPSGSCTGSQKSCWASLPSCKAGATKLSWTTWAAFSLWGASCPPSPPDPASGANSSPGVH